MKKDRRSAGIISWRSLLHLLLIVEIAVCADVLSAVLGVGLPAAGFYVAAIALWILLNRFSRVRGKRLAYLCMALPCALLVCALVTFVIWRGAAAKLDYEAGDVGKASLYADRKVMIVVPHEDDDLNLAGGVIEEYVGCGSEVYMVFFSNGDYYGIGAKRINEAIREAAFLGVPEDHVIFLGYGDRWRGGRHIYNAEPGEVMVSAIGKTETYGTSDHPAYREGHAYTIDNLLTDMRDVILEYRPDTILCSDYDTHIDHRATDLTFERALGQILREQPEYSPTVLKGFAYNSAFNAPADYLTLNVGSTTNVYEEPNNQWPRVYAWEERIRLPIDPANLSRSLFASKGCKSLSIYASQGIIWESASILNGDKVFWHRRIDSLCYDADISVSSGDADKLNDFMLLDSNDLQHSGDYPCDGTWVPDAQDDRRTITVQLRQPQDIHEIVLYDNPSEQDNVLNAEIVFDNGNVFTTGALNPDGMESVFTVNEKGISSFEIIIRESEGERAGLTEVEAYSAPREAIASYIKLMDGNGNFVYDYITPDPSGAAELFLYRSGDCAELDASAYDLAWDNAECSVEIIGGCIRVNCPEGMEVNITITSTDGDASDCVRVQNPGERQRANIRAIQRLEQIVYDLHDGPILRRTVGYRTFVVIRGLFRMLIRR